MPANAGADVLVMMGLAVGARFGAATVLLVAGLASAACFSQRCEIGTSMHCCGMSPLSAKSRPLFDNCVVCDSHMSHGRPSGDARVVFSGSRLSINVLCASWG
mmetsp:Transcript_16387/g.49115  ORF Transcript_16387/g.49115 Transcript_16387/m.49115 type:complete len:103 (+) Transcript_16387:453-761(+)